MHLEKNSFLSHSFVITVEMVAFYSVCVFQFIYLFIYFTFEIIMHLAELIIKLKVVVDVVRILDVCWEIKARPYSPACVCMCVLFFQSVIVIPLAQSVIAVMAQDFVYVRRAQQGLSVRSVYPAICGTMAANVSRTTTLPTQLPDSSPPQLCVSLLSLSEAFSLCMTPEPWLTECAAHAQD